MTAAEKVKELLELRKRATQGKWLEAAHLDYDPDGADRVFARGPDTEFVYQSKMCFFPHSSQADIDQDFINSAANLTEALCESWLEMLEWITALNCGCVPDKMEFGLFVAGVVL